MREKKWTPGPWTVMNSAAIWLIYGADEVVTRVAKIFITINRSERKANAALISAAPELLEALEMITRSLPTRRDWLDPDIESYMKAVIAKSYGETP